jgi:hypothetical protein
MRNFGHQRRNGKPSPARAVTLEGLPWNFGPDRNRRMIVTLDAGDLITLRPAGTRRAVSVPVVEVYHWVLRSVANRANLEKARERKARKAERLARQRQARAEKRLFVAA